MKYFLLLILFSFLSCTKPTNTKQLFHTVSDKSEFLSAINGKWIQSPINIWFLSDPQNEKSTNFIRFDFPNSKALSIMHLSKKTNWEISVKMKNGTYSKAVVYYLSSDSLKMQSDFKALDGAFTRN